MRLQTCAGHEAGPEPEYGMSASYWYDLIYPFLYLLCIIAFYKLVSLWQHLDVWPLVNICISVFLNIFFASLTSSGFTTRWVLLAVGQYPKSVIAVANASSANHAYLAFSSVSLSLSINSLMAKAYITIACGSPWAGPSLN